MYTLIIYTHCLLLFLFTMTTHTHVPTAMAFLFNTIEEKGTDKKDIEPPVQSEKYDLTTLDLASIAPVEKHYVLRQACEQGNYGWIKKLVENEKIPLQPIDLKNAIHYVKDTIESPALEQAEKSLVYIYDNNVSASFDLFEDDILFLIHRNIMSDNDGQLTHQLLAFKKIIAAQKLWENVPIKNSSTGKQVLRQFKRLKILPTTISDQKKPSLTQLYTFLEKNNCEDEIAMLNDIIELYNESH